MITICWLKNNARLLARNFVIYKLKNDYDKE
jgi:hypothetical protein